MSGDTVVRERHLRHPPEKVWRALTLPHLLGEWLLPGDFRAEVGHRFTFDLGFDRVACEVLEVEAPTRLSYSWCAMGLESVVTFTLAPEQGGTALRMEQRGFTPEQTQARKGATAGWSGFLDRLATTLDLMDRTETLT